jgi:Mn2+/Fe2+ NRAMP family transporter
MSLEAKSGLEPWGRSDLPAPPPTRGFSLLAIIGPGAIILGLSIGSGEWLIGPAAFVKYGLSLLWVTLAAVFLQTILNTELMRYTLYTGEPAVTGFMRTRPNSTFWAWFYTALYFLHAGWPAWAANSAGALYFLFFRQLPGEHDGNTVYWLAVCAYLACVMVLLFGRRIERTLELLNWALIVFILGGMLFLCLLFFMPQLWLAALAGFFGFDVRSGSFNFIPPGADWFLIGAFAAYSGAGGVSNLMLSNWARDKGFGMGSVVGFIPAAVGGQKVKLAHTGSTFDSTAENLSRWRGWWRIVAVDQWGVFFAGALLGMGLPAILYVTFIQPGRDIRDLAIAAELAHAVLARGGALLAGMVALMSAWVLFKTQLDNVDGMARALTDILWTGSRRVRNWRAAGQGGDVRVLYYTLLAIMVVWGVIALRMAKPIVLLQLAANIAGVVMVISALHILYVNVKFLPLELRPPMWRRLCLVAMALFYGFFAYLWLMGGLTPNPEKGFLFQLPKLIVGLK